MDQSQEHMKFIGIFGILSQSFKTILKWKTIFTQITCTFILPLTIIFIAHMEISRRFFAVVEQNPFQLFTDAAIFYRTYIESQATPIEWIAYLLFKTLTVAIITVLSLLSTATVVYTVASVYTDCDVTYRKSMKVICKVWKRLTVTFLSMYLMFFTYHLLVAVAVFLWRSVVTDGIFFVITFFPFIFAYVLGFIYLSIVWQLAIVVSVLESSYGLKAMIKATDLMKGKTFVAIVVSFLLNLLFVGVAFIYLWSIVVDNWELPVVWKVVIGIICLILWMITFLVLMVIQTVLYVVCKSNHQEPIDKLSITTYLGAYLSDSQPAFMAGTEDIQLGRPRNQSAGPQV